MSHTIAHATQEGLAERDGLSARRISDIERGLKLRPLPETVVQLADALGLPSAQWAHLELMGCHKPVGQRGLLRCPRLMLSPAKLFSEKLGRSGGIDCRTLSLKTQTSGRGIRDWL